MSSVPRVVSVEDDHDIYTLIQLTLQSLPLELYHARTGREAIDLIVELEPQLLVLDVALPDIHGWDVLKELIDLDVRPPHILVLTAHIHPTHRIIGRLQNVSAYLCKPFDPADLRQHVSQLLGLA